MIFMIGEECSAADKNKKLFLQIAEGVVYESINKRIFYMTLANLVLQKEQEKVTGR